MKVGKPVLPAAQDAFTRRLVSSLTSILRNHATAINDYHEGTAAPTTGDWKKSQKVWNTNPSELGSASSKYTIVGWICTADGTPGTWLEMRCLTGN